LRNYEGYISAYQEPLDYDPTLIDTLDRQTERRPEAGQSGVLGLLQGQAMDIKPEGFDTVHQRNAATHRLNQDHAKWQPHNIGGGAPHHSNGKEATHEPYSGD
jgi:lysine 2,3-aminomutase